MKGWQIFVHSVRLVLNNLDVALRVSLVLYLVQAAYQVVAIRMLSGGGGPADAANGVLALPILGIAAIVASLWIAVAWHRFVLTEEMPRGWLPVWHGPEILGYLGRSLMIGFVVAFALLIAALVILVVPILQVLLLPGMVLAGSYFFFRLGVMLPAGTVGRRMTLSESWTATKDNDGAIIVLAIIMMMGALLLELPSMVSGDPTSVISVVYSVVTGWFATMIGVSVLTTLYGHYVEGRAID